jgi:hypothetical protein
MYCVNQCNDHQTNIFINDITDLHFEWGSSIDISFDFIKCLIYINLVRAYLVMIKKIMLYLGHPFVVNFLFLFVLVLYCSRSLTTASVM